jgi:hypothetical protein
VGVLTNTLVKLALVLTIGGSRYRTQAGRGLFIIAVASAMTLFLAR